MQSLLTAMGTRCLPTGLVINCSGAVQLWAWAMHFAHASAGMGFQLETTDGALRAQSVCAPRYGMANCVVALDGGELIDCGEQVPIRISLADCQAALKDPLNYDWMRVARQLADEALRRWEDEI